MTFNTIRASRQARGVHLGQPADVAATGQRARHERRTWLYLDTAFELPQAETDALREVGFDVDERGDELAVRANATAEETIEAYATLIRAALPIAKAAARLNVHESTVHRHLGERSLHGLRADDGRWVIPAWQFDGDRLLPGLATVVRASASDLHPLSFECFMVTSHCDLVDEETGLELCPRDWLRSKRSAQAVAALVSDL
jgi:hypothetical protein